MGVRLAVVLLVACSGSKPKVVEDARKLETPRDVASPASGPYAVVGGPASDVQVRVLWTGVPSEHRASSGRTACGTPRAAAVAPTVLWGIPEVFVVLAAEKGKAMTELAARVVLDQCAFAPRAIVAGKALDIASGAEAPVKLSLVKQGELADPAKLAAGTSRDVMLPVAGHEVTAALDAGAIYRLAAGDDAEVAWIVAAPQPYVGITDHTGAVILRDVPLGTYAVTAWLPPRAGKPGRVAKGQVTVVEGPLSDVTLDLASP